MSTGGCNSTELDSAQVCAEAVPGRSTNATACDRAFTSACGAVAGNLSACENW